MTFPNVQESVQILEIWKQRCNFYIERPPPPPPPKKKNGLPYFA